MRNNRFVGPGGDTVGNYGLQNYATVESIEDNLFLDHRRAINHDGLAGADVSGNEFRDNALAIASGADDGVIRDNRFTIPDGGYQAIGLYGERNTISGNTITASGRPSRPGTARSSSTASTKRFSDNVIEDNTFTGAGPAVVAGDNSFADDNTISGNAFLNTGVVVVNEDDDDTLDVSNNWWGAEGGPTRRVVSTAGGDVVTSPSLTAEILDVDRAGDRQQRDHVGQPRHDAEERRSASPRSSRAPTPSRSAPNTVTVATEGHDRRRRRLHRHVLGRRHPRARRRRR